MGEHGLAAILMVAALTACDRQAPPPPANANNTEPAAPPVIETRVAGCADGWTIELDREAFAHNGAGRTFPDARLAAFREELGKGVRRAVSSACREGALDPAKAKAVKRLVARTASGADDPVFFAEDSQSLELEWTFAENDLTIPSEMELRGGLVCWTEPASADCTDREP
jgi:hypothetical protein